MIASAKRKRWLLVGPLPPPFAGPEMAMEATINSMIADEFDVAVINTTFRRFNSEKGKIGFAMITSFFVFVTRLVSQLLIFRPHGVYYFVTATRLGWIGRDIWCVFLSRCFGARPVIHMRAGHFRHSIKRATFVERWFIRRACRMTSLNIVQAPSLKDQFEGLAPAARIRAVPNMVDTGKYHNARPTDCDRYQILFLGHLSFAKGYCDILQAIPGVVESYPDVRFLFAGAKLQRERNVLFDQMTGESLKLIDPDECFQTYIGDVYAKNYKYLGVVDEGRKLELLRTCNFLILPSYSEGFSMAVLEALAMAKPIVCTPVGALRDFVIHDRNGFIVNPGDVPALTSVMKRLIRDKACRDRIALFNHKYARKHFARDVVSHRLCELFASVIAAEPEKKLDSPACTA